MRTAEGEQLSCPEEAREAHGDQRCCSNLACRQQKAGDAQGGESRKGRSSERQLGPIPSCVQAPTAWKDAPHVQHMLQAAYRAGSKAFAFALLPKKLEVLLKLFVESRKLLGEAAEDQRDCRDEKRETAAL